jgi:hypothetical protein
MHSKVDKIPETTKPVSKSEHIEKIMKLFNKTEKCCIFAKSSRPDL